MVQSRLMKCSGLTIALLAGDFLRIWGGGLEVAERAIISMPPFSLCFSLEAHVSLSAHPKPHLPAQMLVQVQALFTHLEEGEARLQH